MERALRTPQWAHLGLTAIGRTTAALLQMNTPDRVELRLDLLTAGLWE